MDDQDRNKLDRIAEGVARIDERTVNLEKYIAAVSVNTKEVRAALEEHKADAGAHGIKAARGALKDAVGWLGLVVACGAAFIEYARGKH